MSQTIFEHLRSEHDKHRTLIDIIEKTSGDSRGRNELFPKLADEVLAHAHAEERVFYAELLARSESRDVAGHSVEEHNEAEEIIDELRAKDYGSSGWLTRFKLLADKLRHHMAEEEREVFPLAGRLLSTARKREMVDEFEQAKATEAKKVA